MAETAQFGATRTSVDGIYAVLEEEILSLKVFHRDVTPLRKPFGTNLDLIGAKREEVLKIPLDLALGPPLQVLSDKYFKFSGRQREQKLISARLPLFGPNAHRDRWNKKQQ